MIINLELVLNSQVSLHDVLWLNHFVSHSPLKFNPKVQMQDAFMCKAYQLLLIIFLL
jgi:hypothetical protein